MAKAFDSVPDASPNGWTVKLIGTYDGNTYSIEFTIDTYDANSNLMNRQNATAGGVTSGAGQNDYLGTAATSPYVYMRNALLQTYGKSTSEAT